ncbi:MAG: cell division/cell wall cluster transcriptional repressor MraZ [Candidatus Infernicultor aquiphilus]|uniref:Transcriptional regulator MraZ n=1 Tax=Candidatus Infernicultor aquiphilus TaxID=1805029 RepID=A0A1J5GE24_9BACT|nr:MAG: cell division/cell wall cluster transcriptional repressor MraZ [Candidatus Atribacteria bacterium CG2_30_33_13]PIU24747.1 MAG: cell division/cell wall cluster transcriptional repressor MraZ [Candidatus Atribacteria bacterium CG08_land_8_20_14_0_20_33_29]PIW11591.1 MAG: cell division/cell wall cluster transcriptional repressor MraZ [Candidatus Atribacteria bacterium CG17_big_fil_post_rev_8_21_14_2_50_34_11]PIX35225.1 MAG: cell division/cell wall cluster transcriptional repressor MraZ [Can
MFLGQYEHTIDEKGRLIVPAKYREPLGDNFIITYGLDVCLFVYSLEEWKTLAEKLKSLPLGQRDARAFKRILFSRATNCTIDSQGRVIIMKYLREYARIDKEVMIIGVSDRIEIWSKDIWQKYFDKIEDSYEDIAERVYEKEE